MCEYLSSNVRRTMEHAIVKEEKIPLEYVTNLDQVVNDIQDKFTALKVRAIGYVGPSEWVWQSGCGRGCEVVCVVAQSD